MVIPRAMPTRNATPSKVEAPLVKASTKTVSFTLAIKPITMAPTRNVLVISTNHQSRKDTPIIISRKHKENTMSMSPNFGLSLAVEFTEFRSNCEFIISC